MSTSQAVILRDLVREYGLGRAGTATSSSTTTLVDASNFGGPIPGGVFPNGSPIRLTSGARAGDNSYKQGAIDPTTGTITNSPVFGGAPGTPTFIISTVVEHCDRLVEAMNRSLTRRCSRWFKVPLTDVPDGDFLGDLTGGTLATAWTATNAAISAAGSRYVSLTFPDAFMARGASVLTTGVNGYIQSTSIPVHPLTTRYFMVAMRATAASMTAEIQLKDITNANAAITLTFDIGAATTTSKSFVIAKGSYTVPAGCSQVAWRLLGQESAATVIFGPVLDVQAGQTTFASQPHLNSTDDMGAFYFGSTSGVGSIANPGPETIIYTSYQVDGVNMSDFGWGVGLNFATAPAFPTWFDEYGFYPALTSDTDTTDAPEELVLCGAAMELYQMLASEDSSTPQAYRGKIVPTAVMLKLQNAEKKWRSGFMQRLRAEKGVSIKRTYKAGVYA